jgi:alkylation response protein AidB-like acyl-CoA dehydrogenase
MLSGEHFWCQGYSEPASGSDLASLQMAASDDGDSFVCNGTKNLDHARSGCELDLLPGAHLQGAAATAGHHVSAHRFDEPRIAIRRSLADRRGHSESDLLHECTRAEDKRRRAGGAGWAVAKHVLEFERGGSAYAPRLQAELEDLRAFASAVPGDATASLLDDPLFKAKLAAASIRAETLEVYELRVMSKLGNG